MSTTENKWDAYFEGSIEKDRDPVLDDPIIYGNNIKKFTVTVYSPDGRVSKYWNARILKDLTGYCRIACPREKKILHFNWFKWSAFFFVQSGIKELVLMPEARRKSCLSLTKEVK